MMACSLFPCPREGDTVGMGQHSRREEEPP